jgi:hypothetical protein
MAGELAMVEVDVRVEERLEWWHPLVQSVAATPHLLLTGVLSGLSVVVGAATAIVVLLTGRVPDVVVRFQVMTLRERVRCFSYWFALRTGYPPIDLSLTAWPDRGDDRSVSVSFRPSAGGVTIRRRDVPARLLLVGHLAVLVPIALFLDACYPMWILLAAANRGWPAPLRRFLVAVEHWVVSLAAYGLLLTDVPPAFGLRGNGYEVAAGGPGQRPADTRTRS